jgi:hypothetical protein
MRQTWILVAPLLAAFAASWLAACDQGLFAQDQDEVKRDTLSNPPIDSLAFWPPAMRYARAGDTLQIRMKGFHLGYTCGEISELRWNWRDSIGFDYYTLLSKVYVPGGPSCKPGGRFDSTFRVIFYSHAGERLFVRHGDNLKTDSLLFVSGFGYTETFVHRDADADTALIERGGYRFTYHDSTAARPRRTVTAMLPICETFQSSVFKREGDSITVRLRRIVARPLPAAAFPACAGEHPDTMEVVRDLYGSF